MEKEIWKDEVVNSLQGMKRAEPNPFLLTRIEERLKSPSSFLPNRIISFPKLSLAFAGVTLLFVLNFIALKKADNPNFTSTYSLNNINYQLY